MIAPTKLLTIFLFAGVVSGCSSIEVTQAPIPYEPTRTIYAKGTTDFTVRTYTGTGFRAEEVAGASCTMATPSFRSSFVTPAIVQAPDMGRNTPVNRITCTYKGQTEAETVDPYNVTVAEIEQASRNAASGNGLIGALVATTVQGARMVNRNPAADVFAYPDVKIEFDR